MQRIVLKLGGSLLHQRDWPKRLQNLIATLGFHEYFLIVGGGDLIEAMRTLDSVHSLNEIEVHWRCVDLLNVTSDIVWELLSRFYVGVPCTRITHTDEFCSHAVQRAKQPAMHLVDSTAFYSKQTLRIDGKAIQPPRAGWRTTTDAIAIYAAALLDADRCILLKSCDIADGMSLMEASQQGIVDEESLTMYGQYKDVSLMKL